MGANHRGRALAKPSSPNKWTIRVILKTFDGGEIILDMKDADRASAAKRLADLFPPLARLAKGET